ncbi:MAG: FAD-dependent oxidoreductase [Clostridiales bacterium]|nr:FAD-dependent oxidoreductase [Clostridiales bacterium]
MYESLFTPLKIGSVTIKNRVVLCAMGGTAPFSFMGGFNEKIRDYYIERCKGNVGLIIPGVTGVIGRDGPLYEEQEIFLGPVRKLMKEIHSYGTKYFLQLGAGFGRASFVFPGMPEDIARKMHTAPSDGLPNVWDPSVKHRGLTEKEIADIIDAFGKTAALCKEAGIDGVEIHAVHEGYLLDQFAISNTNHRTDKYGGSLENRLRFATDIIREIKKTCGADYPVSVRYSVTSKMRGFNQAALPGEAYEEFGRSMEESPAAARILQAAGADMLNADNGSYDSWFWAHPPVYMPLSCNLPEVSYIKNFVDIPVICAGRMENPETAAKAVENGLIDGVGVARQFLADPHWLNKARAGKTEDIRPCIACHNGCFPMTRYKGVSFSARGMARCALNPAAMDEAAWELKPALKQKKIAVAGGGIGGMEAARLLTLRGHNVTLFEKSPSLGGVFTAAAAPSFKEKDKQLLEWYSKQIRDLNVDVRLGTEATPALLAGFDEVIVATGSAPRRLRVPGADGPAVMEAADYLLGQPITGKTVVVIGGGLTGCEIAYDLALKGNKAVIVEMQDDILKVDGLCAANSNMLREIIRYYDIDVHLENTLMSISEAPQGASVVIKGAGGELTELKADQVVMSVGYVSQASLKDELIAAGRDESTIHVVGDAGTVGNLNTVIYSAYETAYAI